MLNGQGNAQAELIDILETKIAKGLGRYVLVGKHFQDRVIDTVYQALLKLMESPNLENLITLETNLTECQAAGKLGFPYPEIRESLAQIRSSFEGQSNGTSPRKNKP
jgi:hypothetical protein